MTQQGYGYPDQGPTSGVPYPGMPQSAPPAHGYPVPPGAYAQPVPQAGGYGVPGGGYVPPPLPLAPNGAPLADFGSRLLARLIDGAILGAVAMVLAIPLGIGVAVILANSMQVADDGTSSVSGMSILGFLGLEAMFLVVIFAMQYVYEVEYSRRSGQTVGKRVMKLKIVPLDPALELSRGMLVKRWLVQVGAGFVPGLSLLDGLWQLWDQPFKQCLHDKAGKTTVIKLPG